jgi:hypothetical protein
MLSGGTLAFVGFLLSPLSWWNDAFINIPLALGFACVVAFFYKPAFDAAFLVGYWLTNVAGFVLMHKGGQKMIDGAEKRYDWKVLVKDILISLLYTLLIVALIRLKVLDPICNALPSLNGK